MTEVGFYHLTRSDITAALPPLLGRSLQANARALVVCPDAASLAALDKALWLSPKPDWLPHGTPASAHPQWQPIFLTLEDHNPADANFLFRIGGAVARAAAFERVFDLFNGNSEAEVLAARTRWREEKAAGHSLAYWQQGETGWEKV